MRSMKIHTLLRRQTGLNLTVAQVERAVTQRMRARGILVRDKYAEGLSPQELDELAELVVVPESWMFRDADSFRAASDFVRARLGADPKSAVRILSMPCAGGEEPYSMAMALFDGGVAPDAYRIDAIDLSREAIAVARRASYSQNAFRGTELSFRDRYFVSEGERYQLSDRVRSQVDFRQGNLLTLDVSAAAGTYSVIFCRNLLIYFDEPTVEKAIGQLRTLLADDGMLLAGHAELPWFCRYGFAASRRDGAFVLHKAAATAAPRGPAVPRPLRSAPGARASMTPPTLKPAAPQGAPRTPLKAAPAPAAKAPTAAALLELAGKCADCGQLEQALQHCEAALASQAELPEAFYLMGVVSASKGQPAAAFEHWRRCVYLDPNHYEALCHLALLASDGGDAKGADAYRQRAARVFAKHAAHGGGA
jgi:chemotaxis protein methyltransferase WspC